MRARGCAWPGETHCCTVHATGAISIGSATRDLAISSPPASRRKSRLRAVACWTERGRVAASARALLFHRQDLLDFAVEAEPAVAGRPVARLVAGREDDVLG